MFSANIYLLLKVKNFKRFLIIFPKIYNIMKSCKKNHYILPDNVDFYLEWEDFIIFIMDFHLS